MVGKKAVKYSIVRYRADELANEIINVGVIFHILDSDSPTVKYFLIDENSSKIKSIIYNNVGNSLYKSYKEMFDFYLSKAHENITGTVGNLTIAGYSDINLLNSLLEFFKDRKMNLTEPSMAMTSNVDQLFNSVFDTYVGNQYLPALSDKIAVKQYVHQIFKEKKLLDKKVIYNFDFKPIDELDDLKFKIDFKFKNGVDNFMHSIPTSGTKTHLNEWFAKTTIMFNNFKQEDKVYLLFSEKLTEDNMILNNYKNYFLATRPNTEAVNIDNTNRIEEICEYIQREAQDIA